jgi:hypothetical protein
LDCEAAGTPHFMGEVRNTGDITLTNVVVMDRLTAASVALAGPFILAPGEAKYFFVEDGITGGLTSSDAVEVQASGAGLCGGAPALSVAYCDGLEPQPGLLDIRRSGADVMIRWASNPGRSYQVQYRASLFEGNWLDLPGQEIAIGSATARLDDATVDQTRFYRVLILPP